jgi:hypothetical protein
MFGVTRSTRVSLSAYAVNLVAGEQSEGHPSLGVSKTVVPLDKFQVLVLLRLDPPGEPPARLDDIYQVVVLHPVVQPG